MINRVTQIIIATTLILLSALATTAQNRKTSAVDPVPGLALAPELGVSVQLNISTSAGGATVTGNVLTGLFAINFGNVNGLGLGTPVSGVTVVTDASGALYKTPISLQPIYVGLPGQTATIEVEQDPGGDTSMAREGSSSISASSTVGTTPTTIATGIATGATVTRWVGLYVSRTEPAGSKTITLIYTITIE